MNLLAGNNDAHEKKSLKSLRQHDHVERLFREHHNSLYRYLARLARPEDAAELAQETYYRLLRLSTSVKLEAASRGLLFHIATNLARDHRRRQISHHAEQHSDLDEQAIAEGPLGPFEQLASEQTFSMIEDSIQNLPPETCKVFLMHRVHGLSYPQIAKSINISTRTVARRMADALERLGAAVDAAD